MFQGIRYAELGILIDTEAMIGQHLDTLHIVERVNERAQAAKLVRVVGEAGYEHMAYPHRLADVAEIPHRRLRRQRRYRR